MDHNLESASRSTVIGRSCPVAQPVAHRNAPPNAPWVPALMRSLRQRLDDRIPVYATGIAYGHVDYGTSYARLLAFAWMRGASELPSRYRIELEHWLHSELLAEISRQEALNEAVAAALEGHSNGR